MTSFFSKNCQQSQLCPIPQIKPLPVSLTQLIRCDVSHTLEHNLPECCSDGADQWEEAECCCVQGPSASTRHWLPGNTSTGPGLPGLLRDAEEEVEQVEEEPAGTGAAASGLF